MEQLNRNNFIRWEGDPEVLDSSPLVARIYYGATSAVPDEAEILALPYTTNDRDNWVFSYTLVMKRIMIAIPAGMPALTSALSANGFNSIAGFDKINITLLIGADSIPYVAYVSNSNTIQDNYILKFT